MPLPLSANRGFGMKVTVLPYWLAVLRMMYLYNIDRKSTRLNSSHSLNGALPIYALMHMHAAAVVGKQRLRHEGHRLAVLVGRVADDVFVQHHVVGRLHQRVEALVDLALAAGGHFVVMAFDVQPALDHGLHHLAAQILVVIRGRHREVAFLIARPVAQVVFLAARIPAALFGVDEIEAAMLVLVEAYVVENEKLGFG